MSVQIVISVSIVWIGMVLIYFKYKSRKSGNEPVQLQTVQGFMGNFIEETTDCYVSVKSEKEIEHVDMAEFCDFVMKKKQNKSSGYVEEYPVKKGIQIKKIEIEKLVNINDLIKNYSNEKD